MKKQSKVLTMLIACCMALLFTCGITNALSKVRAEDSISRGEWIHTLVETFSMTVEDGQMPDAYYSDIAESEYYNDIMLAVNFGVIDLEAGEEFRPDAPVTREFAAQTINDCLCYMLEEETYTMTDYEDLEYPQDAQIAINQGWFELIDGAFAPETAITVLEQTTMITHAEEVLAVSVISENHENVYEFAEGIKEITEGTAVELLSNAEIMIYDTSLELTEGESFVVYSNGIAYPYKAVTVTEQEYGFLVVGEELEYEEAVTSYDAEGIVEADLGEFVPADGVKMDVEYEETETSSYSSRIGGTKKVKDIVVSKEIGKGEISCTITNIKVKYRINSKGYHFSVKGKATTEYTMSGSQSGTVTLGYINVAGIGKIQVDGVYSADGSMTLSYSCNMDVGVEYNKSSGLRVIKSFTSPSWHFSAQAELKVACKVGFYIKIPAVASGSIYGEVGVKANPAVEIYDDESAPTICMDLPAHIYALVKYSVKVFGKDVAGDTITIYNESNSPCRICYHIEDGKWVDVCARLQNETTESSSDVGKRKYYTTSTTSESGSSSETSTYSSTVWIAPSVTATEPTFEYELDENDNATITGYNGGRYCMTIPEEIDGYPVVAIGDNVFKDNTFLGKVVIPEGVTSIGSRAFSGCESLTTVVIPDSVTIIGSGAFYKCTRLSGVELPKNLEMLHYEAFYKCDAITSITIPKSLEKASGSVGNEKEGPFGKCNGLKEVKFEEGTTHVARYLFQGCDGLEEIVIPSTITSIDTKAFAECEGLKKVVLPDSVTIIETNAFYNCSSLESVTLSQNLTEIEDGAFYNCSKLSGVELPKNLETLHYQAFYNCDAITSITIPKSLELASGSVGSEGEGPFGKCDGLKEVQFEEGTTRVAQYLFEGCDGLEEIVIPSTVTSIATKAFAECKGLKSVVIPDSVITIEENVFSKCINLSEIHIPDTVTSMGTSVFSGCTNLQVVHLPEDRKDIPSSTFERCTSLMTVNFSDMLLERIGEKAFSNCESLTDLTLPEGIITIGARAFEYCKELKEVTLPDSVETLGNYAFSYCDNLSTVNIGDGLKVIPIYCFYENSALEKVVLPQQVTTVNSYAFGNCANLTEVTMNHNVSAITPNAFTYPANLTIRGISGTYPETFAAENGITFVALKIPVTAIIISDSSKTMVLEETYQLSATVYPSTATEKNIHWSSSDEKVVTVDENGKVTAIAEGTANITATAMDDSGIEAICVITVTKKQESTQQPNDGDSTEEKPGEGGSAEEKPGEGGSAEEKPDAGGSVEDKPSTEDSGSEQPNTQEVLPAVGTKKTLSSGQYKVTTSNTTTKEVTFVKPKSSKKTSVTIPSTVIIDGYAFKVTAISDKAFKNNKKIKSVTIGKNISKIGKEAFSGCEKLKKITIKSVKLKSVGKNAIKGIYKKAVIKVPKKQLSKYKKLFKSKTGYKNTMKIKK